MKDRADNSVETPRAPMNHRKGLKLGAAARDRRVARVKPETKGGGTWPLQS